MEEKKKERIVGIDLGTSNSAAAAIMGGRPVVIPSAEGTTVGGKAFPSYVAITESGDLLVGEPARRQAAINPAGTVTGFKRKMGENYKYDLHGKEYTPQQLSAFLLQKIKRDVEAFLGEEIKKAVITAPAYFNDNQRQATKDAGKIAGLDVVRIINEPTAASLAYGLDKADQEQKILVFDFGGGTLDVTLLEFGEGVFEVKSTSGDTQLGGTDMDERLTHYLIEEFKKEKGIDLTDDKKAIQRVREAAEKAKIELSSLLTTDISLPFIAVRGNEPVHLEMSINRAKLEELVNPVVERCRGPIERAIADANYSKADISKAVLVGGPTRMPIVQRFVESVVGKPPERGVDPMECVAQGAAIQAGVLAGEVKDLLLLDVTPLSLGIETLGEVFTRLIERDTTIPTRKSRVFTTAADFQTAVTIHVLQGEREMARDNVSLGTFNLEGIPPAPRGIPQIEVTFDIDANGILNVSAKDMATRKEQRITIQNPNRLSDQEVERMKREAKEFEEQDRKKREEAELMNEADQFIYNSEKLLADAGDKLSDEDKNSLASKINYLRDSLKARDVAKVKSSLDELKDELSRISTKIYGASYQGQGEGFQPGGPSGA
jgi:molecular chaperone DnaK